MIIIVIVIFKHHSITQQNASRKVSGKTTSLSLYLPRESHVLAEDVWREFPEGKLYLVLKHIPNSLPNLSPSSHHFANCRLLPPCPSPTDQAANKVYRLLSKHATLPHSYHATLQHACSHCLSKAGNHWLLDSLTMMLRKDGTASPPAP